MDGWSEQELIRHAKAGDKLAYEELLRPNLTPATRLARVLLGGPGEAEDAVQEAAIKGWRKLNNLRAGAGFRPWFLGIVVRQVRTVQRAPWWSVIRMPSLSASPNQTEGEWLEGQDLRRAVSRLPQGQAEAVVMHFYLDMRVADVAVALGLSVAAVKSRINRALHHLRQSMGRRA
jgi:RNA polymerase sigma-70 factor (ECF subfamily)